MPPEGVSSVTRSSSMSHWPVMEAPVAGAQGVVSQKPALPQDQQRNVQSG